MIEMNMRLLVNDSEIKDLIQFKSELYAMVLDFNEKGTEGRVLVSHISETGSKIMVDDIYWKDRKITVKP